MDNATEAGIFNVGQKFSSGRLKIFNTCQNLLTEYRVYRRDEKGHIIKKNDHGLDALRYLIMTGLDLMQTKPDPDAAIPSSAVDGSRDTITGY